MNITNSYTYFGIASNGEIGSRGLIGNERGVFDPHDITKALGIQPFRSWKKGDARPDGSQVLFSIWKAEKSTKGRLDVEAQCMETIKNLKNKILILKKIKEQYDVNFYIKVVPHIFSEEQPLMSFNKEIIEFCYLAGATIEIDTYIYQNED
jgi:hypothetical protein